MPTSPLDFSNTEKPQQIKENMVAYMRLFTGVPGITVYDADVFWIVSHRPAPGNAIYKINWSGDEFEQRIDPLFDQIGQHVDQIDWMVFPGGPLPDLGQRLEAHGMPGGPAGNWLWADLKTLQLAPPVSADFRIEQVRSDAKMMEWTLASEAGFEMELGCFYDAYARHGYRADALSLHYTGYLGDIPVTSATLLDAGGWATIYDVSTPHAFRRQGFGGAITHALMQEIRKRGYSDTWIWSSDIGRSTYRKLGYVEAEFGVREHTWHKGR
jgi:GNAT superfamily N-acetyltransferase